MQATMGLVQAPRPRWQPRDACTDGPLLQKHLRRGLLSAPSTRVSIIMPPRRRAAAPAAAADAAVRRLAPAASSEPSRARNSKKQTAPPPGPRLSVVRIAAAVCVVVFTALYLAARLAGAAYVQSLFAGFEPGEAAEVSAADVAAHSRLFVVDLHCDASFSSRYANTHTHSALLLAWLDTVHRSLAPLLAPGIDSHHMYDQCQGSAASGRPDCVWNVGLHPLSRRRPPSHCRQRSSPGA